MKNKSNHLSAPIGPEVAAFAVVMEARLTREGYDQASSWEGIPMLKLLNQLVAKAKRLEVADPTNASEVFNKAVIIGNLAMMMAEKASRRMEQELGLDFDNSKPLLNVLETESAARAPKRIRSSRSASPQSAAAPHHRGQTVSTLRLGRA